MLLAYFNGVLLSRFRYLQLGPHLSGGVKYEMNPELDRADPKAAANAHAEMRLAGELAARIGAGVRVDEIVLPVKDLPDVGPDTPLLTLEWKPEHQNHDTIGVLIIAYHLGVSDWWGWLWERHAEAERILRDNWDKLERLAGRLLAVEPYASAEDRRAGRPSGHVGRGTS